MSVDDLTDKEVVTEFLSLDKPMADYSGMSDTEVIDDMLDSKMEAWVQRVWRRFETILFGYLDHKHGKYIAGRQMTGEEMLAIIREEMETRDEQDL